jgi:hypothetical protein
MALVISRFRVTDEETGEVRIYLPGNEVFGDDAKQGQARGCVRVEGKAMKAPENK